MQIFGKWCRETETKPLGNYSCQTIEHKCKFCEQLESNTAKGKLQKSSQLIATVIAIPLGLTTDRYW